MPISTALIRNSFGFLFIISFCFSSGCKKENGTPVPATRTYRMGFQNSAPRFDSYDLLLQTLNIWTLSADAAIITTEVPWDSLLNGETPVQYVMNNYNGLVVYYRQKGFKLWVYIDPANGLNRASDANGLVAVGKSIAQDDMQMVYRRFVVVMDSILRPEHLGLALETNLIRLASPDSIYQGVKKAAHDASTDVKAMDANVKLSVSVQADAAWGKIGNGGNGVFLGVGQDFTDFPFMEEMGISSYPYFYFSKPQELPTDYYSRLVLDKSIPVFVSEGGWTSQTFPGPSNQSIVSSPQMQQDYVTRQAQILDQVKAIAVFQLTFTDIDISSLPSNVDPTIKYFAYLGMVDINLQPRPAFTTWKEIFARPLQ